MQAEHEQLAEQIRLAVEIAEGHAENAVTYSREAILAAAQAGELMDAAKGCGKDVYREILTAAEVPETKAKQWIYGAQKLKLMPEWALNSPRQLLLFFADGEPPEEKEPPQLRDDGTFWLKSFSKASEVFQKTLDHRPVAEWPSHEKELFRRMAEPIVKVYQQL